MNPWIAAALLVLVTGAAWGQTKPGAPPPPKPATPVQSPFNPRETFAPIPFPETVNLYRSGDGSPGPVYWQNRADYDISVILDPAAKTLSGHETINSTASGCSSTRISIAPMPAPLSSSAVIASRRM
jgi:hypothetical protein